MSEFYDANQISTPEYRVDLVMCIDGTGSMSKMIETVKSTAKSFYSLFLEAMAKHDPPKAVKDDGLRIKVIVFRDFADSSTKPLEESPFYNLQDPSQDKAFQMFVDGIHHKGGGDAPENALEAIATALKSEWQPLGGRYRRQAIIVFTDTLTYDLNIPDRKSSELYPAGMPRDIKELEDVWENGDQELAPYYSPKNGRLIIFAPSSTGLEGASDSGKTIEWGRFNSWNRVWYVPVRPDGGCEEVDMQQALDVLVGSF